VCHGWKCEEEMNGLERELMAGEEKKKRKEKDDVL
jgi:hypothetical protein